MTWLQIAIGITIFIIVMAAITYKYAVDEKHKPIGKWLCSKGWHSMGKWKNTAMPPKGQYSYRYCKYCSRVERRMVAK